MGRGFVDGCWPGLPTRDQVVGFERVPSVQWYFRVMRKRRQKLKLDAFIDNN